MPAVLITGGTGLIGKNLTRHFVNKGYDVMIITRNPSRYAEKPHVNFAGWDVEKQEADGNAIGKADYIINLAGAGVMEKKWSKKYKKEIIESRTKSSELIVKWLQENPNKVKAVISMSAIGWYGEDRKGKKNKNAFIETDPPDKNFLGETCRLWEESIGPVTQLNKRLVKLRTGIVLSNDGGAFAEFKNPVRFGVAPILAGGKQVLSWIHIDDLCRIFIHAIENENVSGVYNAAAPLPVSNKSLMMQLGKLLRGQFFIPVHVPKFLLKLILGERSIEVLKSATVSSEKIKATGFTFLYPGIDAALKELTAKK
jgi:uncharacterized protein (TIGR01777 family)